MEPTVSLLDQATALIGDFAAEYTPAVLVVLGLAVAIGLALWGFGRLTGLFRKSAK